MARRPGMDAEATRRRVLESALTLIGERGLDGVSIREIGRHAGVTLATVHHYFGTKDGLHAAVIEAMYERIGPLVAEIAALWAGPGVPEAKVAEAARRAFHFARAHKSAIRLLLRTVIESGDVGAERVQRMQRPLLELGGQVFGPGDARVRAHLQNLTFLLARNAVASERELVAVTGCEDLEAALATVEAALVETARALLVPRARPALTRAGPDASRS